jgi:hypothetical protein
MRTYGQTAEINDPFAAAPTSSGEMVLQSSRGFEAVPQMFVRLTGSHLAKPRASRAGVTE